MTILRYSFSLYVILGFDRSRFLHNTVWCVFLHICDISDNSVVLYFFSSSDIWGSILSTRWPLYLYTPLSIIDTEWYPLNDGVTLSIPVLRVSHFGFGIPHLYPRDRFPIAWDTDRYWTREPSSLHSPIFSREPIIFLRDGMSYDLYDRAKVCLPCRFILYLFSGCTILYDCGQELGSFSVLHAVSWHDHTTRGTAYDL